MSKFKNRMAIVLPSVLAAYCMIQGAMLAIDTDPLGRIVGVCVLVWVPPCAYCVHRGYKGLQRKTVAADPTPQQKPADSQAFA